MHCSTECVVHGVLMTSRSKATIIATSVNGMLMRHEITNLLQSRLSCLNVACMEYLEATTLCDLGYTWFPFAELDKYRLYIV